MGDKELIKAILHYQQCLDKYTRRNDEARVLYCLSKLYKMPINIGHLQETGVGRTVNALRKHNGEIAEAAKTLVSKWKEMVASDAEETVAKETSKLESIKNEYKEKTKTYKEKSSSSHRDSDRKKSRSNSTSEEDGDDDEDEEDEVEILKNNSKKTKEESKHSYSSEDEDEKQEEVDNLKRNSKKTKEEPKHSYSSEEEDEIQEEVNIFKNNSKKTKEDTKHNYSSDDEVVENLKHRSKKTKEETKHRYSNDDEEIDNSKHRSKKTKEEAKNRHSSDNKRKHEKHKPSKRRHRSSDESDEENSDKNYKHRRSRSSSEERGVKPEKKHKHSKADSSAIINDLHEHNKTKRKKYSESGEESEHERLAERKHLHKSSKRHHEKREKSKHEHKKDKKDKNKESKSKKEDSKYKEKRSSSSSASASKSSSKSDKKDKDKESKSDKKSKRSSSSSNKPKHSHPEKVSYGSNENGIGSGSGASFAEALGMLAPSSSKVSKKKVAVIHPYLSPPSRDSSPESKVPPLLSSKKLAPLDIKVDNLLPEITPNYRPLGLPVDNGFLKNKPSSEDETLSAIMYNKISRTKVYSGNKVAWGKVPSLFEICTRVLQDNIDALEYTGGVPYLILKPVIERANPDQLFTLEHHNPYLIEDTDELWQLHCNKEFRNKRREEMETWRDMYMRCLDEREAKLRALTANIKQSQDKSLPVRQTKLAYVDSVVKPPRNIARKQAKHGTGSGGGGGGGSDKKPVVTPSARLNALATTGAAGQVSVPNPGSRAVSSSSTAVVKPKKAPLMQKTLALMKSRIFRR